MAELLDLDPRIDEMLSVVNSAGKFWYQADALGSIYTLTTASGDVRARGGYDVFGEPKAEFGAVVGQPFGFTGREHELDAAMTYHRDRYMQVALGRWTQPDRRAPALGASDAAVRLGAQVPAEAWRFTASLGRELAGLIPARNAFGYATSPTGLLDWSGFLECKQDWWGAPLVFGEVSFGPFAVVLFGGVYWGMSTGDVDLVLGVYGELGLFDDQLHKPHVDPTYRYWTATAEAGVGIGAEYGVAESEFKEPGLFLEGVLQVGPIVGVKSHTGWGLFYATHVAFGGGVLVSVPKLAWAWRIADAR